MKRKVDDKISVMDNFLKKQKICRKRCREEEIIDIVPNFKKLKINEQTDEEKYKQYKRDILLYT
jgi:hypothetical protein